MIVEYIRYHLKDHKTEELTAAYAEAAQYLKASPECLAFELTRCAEDQSSAILRIEWASTEGHLQRFRRSAEFQPFLRRIRAFFPEIAEMRHYEPTEVSWRRD